MPKFTTRFSEPLIQPLDQLAAAHGLSRNAFLEHLARQAVQRGFIPIRNGEGFKASAPSGGVLTLIQQDGFVAAGQRDLAADELEAFQQARQLAEQGNWYRAKRLLAQAHFSVVNVTQTA